MTAVPNPTATGSLIDTQTQANLKISFEQDAQAAQLSKRFARIAEIEGFPEIARTFRELAESQEFQAQGTLDLLMRAADPLSGSAMGGTHQNVRAALAAHAEMLDTLDDMARAARGEGFFDVASWYDTLLRARQAHRDRLLEPLEGEV